MGYAAQAVKVAQPMLVWLVVSVTMISQVRRIPDGGPALSNLTTILNDLAIPLEPQLPEGVGFALRAEPNLWVEGWERDIARFVWDVCTRVVESLDENVGVATVDARRCELTGSEAGKLGLKAGIFASIEIAHTADELEVTDFILQAKLLRGCLERERRPKMGGSVTILLPTPRRRG